MGLKSTARFSNLGLLSLVLFSYIIGISHAGSCGKTMFECPKKMGKVCRSYSAFPLLGWSCVKDCDECRTILENKGISYAGEQDHEITKQFYDILQQKGLLPKIPPWLTNIADRFKSAIPTLPTIKLPKIPKPLEQVKFQLLSTLHKYGIKLPGSNKLPKPKLPSLPGLKKPIRLPKPFKSLKSKLPKPIRDYLSGKVKLSKLPKLIFKPRKFKLTKIKIPKLPKILKPLFPWVPAPIKFVLFRKEQHIPKERRRKFFRFPG